MPHPMPSLSSMCFSVEVGPGEVCIEFPGGARMCAAVGVDAGDAALIMQNLMGQINAGLMPLQPFFDVLDVLQKMLQCIDAATDMPDPTGLINCVPGLEKAVNKLLRMLPPYSVPILIKSILEALVILLHGIKADIEAIIRANQRAVAAATRAAELGNIELQVAADCAEAALAAELVNLNESIAPLSRLIGTINAFMKLADLDCITIPLDAFDEISDTMTEPIDVAIKLLTAAKNAIPVPDLQLDAIPEKGDPC